MPLFQELGGVARFTTVATLAALPLGHIPHLINPV